ncbi:hypothetical protein CAEBREN_05355 [Caenorhabditis brenneri]|uniref:DZF domain-containing protein n=1 Tax=Caenorhabditis brenneri TaxID=135651 RepID=G0MM52_CAEBE|nr:hypothetical protein CAEBREN_05355 [Caenorhabditis brenneri]
MYGGYQGAYGAYGNSQQGYPAQQQQQPAQQYYSGVNPYANYGYGTIGSAPPPPPPVPPVPEYTGAYHSFPSTANTTAGGAAAANAQGAFNGYDAAIYNYAQQRQTPPTSQQRPTQQPHHSQNHQQKPMGWRHGGGGRQGRVQGSGDNKQYYCEICKVSCAGGITYKEHLDGKGHKKKEQSQKAGVPTVSLARNKLSYRCELCEITCTGQDTYGAHIKGGRHLKTQQLHRKLGKPVPEDIPTIIAPGEDGKAVETRAKPKWHQQALPGGKKVIGINTVNFIGGHKLNSTGQLEEKKREVAKAVSSVGKPVIEVEDERLKALMAAEEVKPIGEEHVVAERDATGKLIQYHCKICECKFSDPNAKEIHVKGRRHRMSYKNKIDPTFVVDPKPVGGSKKQKAEKQKMIGQIPDNQPPPINFMKGPWFSTPETNNSEILDQMTVDRKYESMNPGPELCTNVDAFTTDIMESLKQVSDKLESEKPEPTEMRTILGCVRVGVFAKNTYIKGEPFVEMVVTCTPIPTKEIIQRIFEEFPNSTTSAGMTIEMDPISPAVFLISTSLFANLKCRLYITSSSIRNDDSVDMAQCPDPTTCIQALAEIRNAKWYESNYLNLTGLQPTVRLFREMRSRYPLWATLDDHKLELVLIHIINSDSYPDGLKITAAFKRALEAISSGFLFSAKIRDPCEKGETYVLDGLTDDHKHALTGSAQYFIRLIAFNQIHEILGVERQVDIVPEEPVISVTHKRALELISGFNGEKLPVHDNFYIGNDAEDTTENEEDTEEDNGEPEAKRGRIEEEAGPVGPNEEPMVQEALPVKEPEPVEIAAPIKEEEPVKEAESMEEAESTEEAEPVKEAVPVKEEEPTLTVEPMEREESTTPAV